MPFIDFFLPFERFFKHLRVFCKEFLDNPGGDNANIVIYLSVNFRYSKLVSFVLHIREELFGYLIAFYVKTGQ